jgi:hypothetical protein
MPPGYAYSHAANPCPEVFDDDEEKEHDSDFAPDMLTDEG